MDKLSRSDLDRFWSKVDKSGDCWLWEASLGSTGYGQFSMGGRKRHRTWKAHRLAFALAHGFVPVYLDHLCNNPRCVNPEHLEEVDHAENMKRMSQRKTKCIHGHDYRVHGKLRKNGRRYCTACWGRRG